MLQVLRARTTLRRTLLRPTAERRLPRYRQEKPVTSHALWPVRSYDLGALVASFPHDGVLEHAIAAHSESGLPPLTQPMHANPS